MGPILIFDKSFLQCINRDESNFLDMFFLTAITPLFYIETLADLEKAVGDGRTPEQVVGDLAYKTPDIHAVPNMHHTALLTGELSGRASVDMRFGRPTVCGGRETMVDGKRGVVHEQFLEAVAFDRWQQGKFLELDRGMAKEWRQALQLISPKDQHSMFPGWYGNARPKNLAEVKAAADEFIDSQEKRRALSFGLEFLDIPREMATTVLDRWESAGCPDVANFAPYFRHIYGVELFFYLARSANLISGRRTNKVDIAYLYYLPFCMVFVSNDKLHRDTTPLFLQRHQTFVWGWDLKEDLARLDEYYSELPEEIKQRGLYHFAALPPGDREFLVTKLWDKHMRKDWRELGKQNDKSKLTVHGDALSMVKRAANAPSVSHSSKDDESADLDYIVTTHYVHRRKGKWNRFPPELDDNT